MTDRKQNSRQRILEAAAAVARESGAGNLSLDAVAARAGISKGGLLYNFPTKAALMRALVEAYIAEFEAQLDEAVRVPGGDSRLLGDYVRLSRWTARRPSRARPACWPPSPRIRIS